MKMLTIDDNDDDEFEIDVDVEVEVEMTIWPLFHRFFLVVTDGPTDRRTDSWTDRQSGL